MSLHTLLKYKDVIDKIMIIDDYYVMFTPFSFWYFYITIVKQEYRKYKKKMTNRKVPWRK